MKAYIDETINNQQAGKTIKPAKNKPLILPELLADVLQEKPKLKGAISNSVFQNKENLQIILLKQKKRKQKSEDWL